MECWSIGWKSCRPFITIQYSNTPWSICAYINMKLALLEASHTKASGLIQGQLIHWWAAPQRLLFYILPFFCTWQSLCIRYSYPRCASSNGRYRFPISGLQWACFLNYFKWLNHRIKVIFIFRKSGFQSLLWDYRATGRHCLSPGGSSFEER